jgi:hypothetical protein
MNCHYLETLDCHMIVVCHRVVQRDFTSVKIHRDQKPVQVLIDWNQEDSRSVVRTPAFWKPLLDTIIAMKGIARAKKVGR